MKTNYYFITLSAALMGTLLSGCNLYETCENTTETVFDFSASSINPDAPYQVSMSNDYSKDLTVYVGTKSVIFKTFKHTGEVGKRFELKIDDPLLVEQKRVVFVDHEKNTEQNLTKHGFKNYFSGWNWTDKNQFIYFSEEEGYSGTKMVDVLTDGTLVSKSQPYKTRWVEHTGLRYIPGDSVSNLFQIYDSNDSVLYQIGSSYDSASRTLAFSKDSANGGLENLGDVKIPSDVLGSYVDYSHQITSPNAQEMWIPIEDRAELQAFAHIRLDTHVHEIVDKGTPMPFPGKEEVKLDSFDGKYSVREDTIKDAWTGSVQIEAQSRKGVTNSTKTIYHYKVSLVSSGRSIVQEGTFSITDSHEYCYVED